MFTFFRIRQVLHSRAGPEAGLLLWWVVFGFVAVKFAFDPLHVLAGLPAPYAESVGVMRLAPDFALGALLTEKALWLLRVGGGATAFLAAWQAPSWKWGGGAFVFFLVHQLLLRGYGHVNHTEIPLLFATLLLVAFEIASREPPDGRVVAVVTFVLLATYSFTGVRRLTLAVQTLASLKGGEVIFATPSMIYWSIGHMAKTHGFNVDGGYWLMGRGLWISSLLNAGFFAVTIVEAAAPLALINKAWRGVTFIVLMGFHVGCLILFDIVFWEQIVLVSVLLPWDWNYLGRARGAEWLRARVSTRS